MAASSIPHPWKYDVFVSFRGEDIRTNFMDHLFEDFKRKGIHAFRDDDELPRGEEISPQLYKAIEESRFLIVIFSQNYASSSWCLRELLKILECKQKENPKHEVQIIFNDVKPTVVRKQTNSYAKAFVRHENLNPTEVAEWKTALSSACELSGWDLQDRTNGYESKFIDSITKEILKSICHAPLDVVENIVGVNSHVDKLNLLQFVGPSKVHMIGICGVSGIGKTTLAKAIYNLMYIHFDRSCFLDDVLGVSKRKGLTQVQKQLTDDIMKTGTVKISNVSQGIVVIKKMMSSKPILLVLDDVDHREQLEALAGESNWFSPGSLIIFTGKDKLLLSSHRVDEIYDVDFLDDDESLELFSQYAFQEKHIANGYAELAEKFVKYVKGHPLALKVLGCFLYGKTVREWTSELDRLKVHPNEEIQRVLRICYNGLHADQQKILLDIACSFVGVNRDFAASVLDSCDIFADRNIRALVDKSLIMISSDMSLQMHDLIQAMARGIVREESMLGKHSRLWISSEIYSVLSGKVTVTEAVEVVDLMLEKSCQQVHINAKAFAQMKNLRILKIYHEKDFEHESELEDFNRKFSGSLEFLSNELRLLHWNGFPFRFLPSSFYPKHIVAIDLSYSNIGHLWTTHKCFIMLKVMKLRHCRMLTSTPDFTEITNLEELTLEGCVNLTKLHPSVGTLKRLVVLDMENCKSLKSFPCKVETESLKVLSLSGCLKVDKLPEGLGRIKTLVELHIARTAITELPSFVGSLRNLESLSFGQYERIPSRWWSPFSHLLCLPSRQQVPQSLVLSSLASLNLLKHLNLSHCNISEVPDSIGGLSHLEFLTLQGNNFTRLPGCLTQLSLLYYLNLHGCRNLEVVPELPPSIVHLYAGDCTSLSGLPERLNPGHIFFSCIFMGLPKSFKNLTIHESQGSMSQPLLLDAAPNSNGSRNQLFSLLQYLALCFPCIFTGCPKSYENLNIRESQGSMSQPLLLDASPNSNGSRNQFFSSLQYLALQINKCRIFPAQGDHVFPKWLEIVYYGNRIPQWFTNQSKGNRVKVDLPSDWCYDKLSGFGFCVVFTPNKYYSIFQLSVNNFDGALLDTSFEDQFAGKCGSDMIWLCYHVKTWKWKKAEKFVTFSFGGSERENIEVKELGVRFVFDEDIEKGFESSMIQDIPTPTQRGGYFRFFAGGGFTELRW